MTRAVVMTTFRRDLLILENTLRGIRKALPDARAIVVDDGSGWEYRQALMPVIKRYEAHVYLTDGAACEGAYVLPGGVKSPSWAFNCGFEAAHESGCDSVLILSSDCIVQPSIAAELDAADPEIPWSPTVVDLDTSMCYVGQPRPLLVPFCVHALMSDIRAIGGFDMEYMKGVCFEDVDFSGRLAALKGGYVISTSCAAWHQSHERTWFEDGHKGWETNHQYTRKKWGGTVPFDDRMESPWGLTLQTFERFVKVTVTA